MPALANSTTQYVSSAGWAAVAAYPAALSTPAAGVLCTNTANSPAVGNERVFICIVSGAISGTEPTLTVTKGAITADGLASWQECTGQPGVNGDTTNSPTWPTSSTVTLGQIIYVASNGSLQIVKTASGNTSGSIPAFSATAGVTTNDGSNVWVSLGLASNFGNFAAPHARTLNADSATWQTAVPAIVRIADNHAETNAGTITLAGGQGTATNPNSYLCVSHTAPSTMATGGSITTTGANALKIQGYGYYNGLTFSCGGGGANAANLQALGTALSFESCTFALATTLSTALTSLTSSGTDGGGLGYFSGCTFTFANAGQLIQAGSAATAMIATLDNCTFAASGTVPTILFKTSTSGWADLTVRDSDLSNITGTLYSAGGGGGCGFARLQNCKLAASPTITAGTFGDANSPRFSMRNCDSAGTDYRFYEQDFMGTAQHDLTTIDNTNPAGDGTTTISYKAITTANASFYVPFRVMDVFLWNTLITGSHTATIQFAGAASLTNAQIWMELTYFAASGSPIGSVLTSRMAPLGTPTTYTTSTDSWGGSPANVQYMQVTFSPLKVGYLRARVYVGKASTTVYVNPLLLIV